MSSDLSSSENETFNHINFYKSNPTCVDTICSVATMIGEILEIEWNISNIYRCFKHPEAVVKFNNYKPTIPGFYSVGVLSPIMWISFKNILLHFVIDVGPRAMDKTNVIFKQS